MVIKYPDELFIILIKYILIMYEILPISAGRLRRGMGLRDKRMCVCIN